MSEPPRPGSHLAGYRLESVLGRGGMGVVFLARQVGLERAVALKVIVPELAADQQFRERFPVVEQESASDGDTREADGKSSRPEDPPTGGST